MTDNNLDDYDEIAKCCFRYPEPVDVVLDHDDQRFFDLYFDELRIKESLYAIVGSFSDIVYIFVGASKSKRSTFSVAIKSNDDAFKRRFISAVRLKFENCIEEDFEFYYVPGQIDLIEQNIY